MVKDQVKKQIQKEKDQARRKFALTVGF